MVNQNWNINSYNRAYNNNLNERFQGENEIYGNMDRNMNYRGPDPFGSFNSGVGSFYNQRPVYPGSAYSPHRGFEEMQFDETVQAPEPTGILKNIKNFGKGIMDNTMFGTMAAGFDATNPRAFNYNPELRGQIDFLKRNKAYGTDQSGLNKITHGALAGKNLQSMFGSNDLIDMYNKQIARHDKTIEGFRDQWGNLYEDDRELYDKKLAIHQKRKADAIDQRNAAMGKTTGGEGIDLTTIKDKVVIDTPPADTGGGEGRHDYQRDRGGGYTLGGGFTGTRGEIGRAGSSAGQGRGHHSWRAEGGRIGYNRGRVVNPGGYAGEEEFEDENVLEFMRDQNVPHSEMVEGPSPFDIRVQELVDEGMSWQQAWNIASQEFGLLAEGQEDSFSDQGLASLV